eukprot:3223465-Rhodomonas_salina.2
MSNQRTSLPPPLSLPHRLLSPPSLVPRSATSRYSALFLHLRTTTSPSAPARSTVTAAVSPSATLSSP